MMEQVRETTRTGPPPQTTGAAGAPPSPEGVGSTQTAMAPHPEAKQREGVAYSERFVKWVCAKLRSMYQFLISFVKGLCPCFFKEKEQKVSPPPSPEDPAKPPGLGARARSWLQAPVTWWTNFRDSNKQPLP